MNPSFVYGNNLLEKGHYVPIEEDDIGGVWKYDMFGPKNYLKSKVRTAKYPKFMEVRWAQNEYHHHLGIDSRYFMKDAKQTSSGDYVCRYDLDSLDGIYKAIECIDYTDSEGCADPYGNSEYLMTRAVVNFPWIDHGRHVFDDITREELASWLASGWETHPIILDAKNVNEENYKQFLGHDNIFLEYESAYNPGVRCRVSFGNIRRIGDAIRFIPCIRNPFNDFKVIEC